MFSEKLSIPECRKVKLVRSVPWPSKNLQKQLLSSFFDISFCTTFFVIVMQKILR